MDSALTALAYDLEAELDWLAHALQRRLDSYFADPPVRLALPAEIAPPTPSTPLSSFGEFLARRALPPDRRLILALAMAPLLRPQLLDVMWARNDVIQRGFSEFGGIAGTAHFLPTGETACFLLAGDLLAERLRVVQLLKELSFSAADILQPLITASSAGETMLSAPLRPGEAIITMLGLDSGSGPGGYPAQLVSTGLSWSDLVLPATTLAQLEEVRDWLQHGPTLMHDLGLGKRLRPGYTCLFHGPPGTGKTLSACLLGKLCQLDVYRIDLSMVVSKYIGETEKNLARLFDLAEYRGWILFFDEADALFGQRTRVDSAHDRYANQEVSYLLQRIEDFSGVVILSSNLRGNIDKAFSRRFQAEIAFPMPEEQERLRLWQEALPEALQRQRDLDLPAIAERHQVSGGTIMNVVRYAALRSLVRGDRCLWAEDIEDGLRRELHKEGRGL